jgi:hypothetical protein
MVEEYRLRLEALDDDELRVVALTKMEGYANAGSQCGWGLSSGPRNGARD